jgi:hypothetical protein
LLARLAGHSVWWRQTDAGQDSTLTVARGLPDAGAYAGLLSGG